MWLAALAFGAPEIQSPRIRGAWIADAAELLPPDVEAALEARIDAVHRDLDAEIVVVTADHDALALVDQWFDTWGVGDAVADNGVLIVVVDAPPAAAIRSGRGLEAVLPDGWRAALVAARPDEAPAVALSRMVDAVEARLREQPDAARLGSAAVDADAAPLPGDPQLRGTLAREFARMQATRTVVVTGVLGLALLGTLSAFGYGLARVRRTERMCPTCHVEMPMLSEHDDDQHLSQGQVTEEQVGAVDYQVHQCPKCGQTRTFVVHQFWTRYMPCPQCNHRTRLVRRRTLVAAAPGVDGTDEILETCAHCDYRATHTRATPALSRA